MQLFLHRAGTVSAELLVWTRQPKKEVLDPAQFKRIYRLTSCLLFHTLVSAVSVCKVSYKLSQHSLFVLSCTLCTLLQMTPS